MNRKPNPNSRDLTIRCCECNADFIWTASEQKYYSDRNLSTPRRCPKCREARRKRASPNSYYPNSAVPDGQDYTTIMDTKRC